MSMKVIEVTSSNILDYPPMCFMKQGTPGFSQKIDWVKARFKEGLKVKLLQDESDKKIHGYIEYTTGENAFRAVEAKKCLFIHCIWMNPNKYKNSRNGSLLINEVIKDAKGLDGVAVITRDGPFMAGKDVFLKNGFVVVQEDGEFQLLAKKLKKSFSPKFKDHKSQLKKLKGWQIFYTDQCPWVARFMGELDKKIIKKLNLKITKLDTPKKAQAAPSIYATFNLIKDGRLLAQSYISNTRFNNILKKEA